jgi:hypothetical protein
MTFDMIGQRIFGRTNFVANMTNIIRFAQPNAMDAFMNFQTFPVLQHFAANVTFRSFGMNVFHVLTIVEGHVKLPVTNLTQNFRLLEVDLQLVVPKEKDV